LERRPCSDLSKNFAYQLIELPELITSIYDIGYLHDLDQVALFVHIIEFESWSEAQYSDLSKDQWLL
jgi:hypothetical protein